MSAATFSIASAVSSLVCSKRRPSIFVASGSVSMLRTLIENVRPMLRSLLECVRLNVKPGFGSRPACTRSASDRPSSAYEACRPRLFSSAI
ncbi:hypothetical protein DO71_3501 [Burkholderia pseudomallei]|nr:hypothetical protein DO71_3501 [Burkholderia pseudomallei]